MGDAGKIRERAYLVNELEPIPTPPGKDGVEAALDGGDPGFDFSGGEDDFGVGVGVEELVDEQDAWDVGDCLWGEGDQFFAITAKNAMVVVVVFSRKRPFDFHRMAKASCQSPWPCTPDPGPCIWP